MNRSAGAFADVPEEVVTVSSTVPLPEGLLAVIEDAELTVTLGGGSAAKVDFGAGRRSPYR